MQGPHSQVLQLKVSSLIYHRWQDQVGGVCVASFSSLQKRGVWPAVYRHILKAISLEPQPTGSALSLFIFKQRFVMWSRLASNSWHKSWLSFPSAEIISVSNTAGFLTVSCASSNTTLFALSLAFFWPRTRLNDFQFIFFFTLFFIHVYVLTSLNVCTLWVCLVMVEPRRGIVFPWNWRIDGCGPACDGNQTQVWSARTRSLSHWALSPTPSFCYLKSNPAPFTSIWKPTGGQCAKLLLLPKFREAVSVLKLNLYEDTLADSPRGEPH